MNSTNPYVHWICPNCKGYNGQDRTHCLECNEKQPDESEKFFEKIGRY